MCDKNKKKMELHKSTLREPKLFLTQLPKLMCSDSSGLYWYWSYTAICTSSKIPHEHFMWGVL